MYIFATKIYFSYATFLEEFLTKLWIVVNLVSKCAYCKKRWCGIEEDNGVF